MSFLTIPQSLTRFRLANARVPVCLVADAAQLKADADGLAPCDIVIEKERIATIAPAAPANDGLPRFDLDRGIVLPRLVDVHTHIDKGHIWARAQNPDGTHMGARTAVMADREANWSRDDVAKRMDFALRCAFAHGTGALRTHIDSYPKQTPISWPLFAEMREHWKGRIALQAVSLYPIDMALNDEPNFRAMVGDGREAWRPARRPHIPWRSAERENRCGARQDLRGRDRKRPRSRFPCRRKRFTERPFARPDRRRGAAPQVQGPHCRRPLLLARARRRQRARHHHRQGRGGAHRGRVAADVQHVSAGPAIRPHAALAWRRSLA